MSMPAVLSATGIAEAWIYQQLANDSTLRGLVGSQVYAGVAPEGATYPLIVLQSLGGVDTTAMHFSRVLSQFRYAVHCADRVGSIFNLDALAARVDALLHGGENVPVNGGYMLACQRERQMALANQVAGVQTREITSTYLLVVQEATDI